jgi:hypothetical protein
MEALADPTLEPEPVPVLPAVEVGVTGALARAAALRFPNLRELRGRDRSEALVDHISDTAIARGELEELRMEAHVSLLEHREQWDAIPTRRGTKAERDASRTLAEPLLAGKIFRARWVVERCTEQINRLDGDYNAASRAYTIISGG